MPHRGRSFGRRRRRRRDVAASPARSDPRPQRARRPGLLPRAQVGARPSRSLCRFAERAGGDLRRLVAASEKMAFWVNAYNAFVLQTVIDRYPIRGPARATRPNSIRQIPGAFESIKPPRRGAQRHARRDREDDPSRVQGTAPVSRARPRRDRQRPAAQRGLHRRSHHAAARRHPEGVRVGTDDAQDRSGVGQVSVTPILSWHEAEFIAAYDKGATGRSPQRSPIERAILAFISPNLLPLEKEFVQKNQFKVTYHPFDWRLNDLTGGRPTVGMDLAADRQIAIVTGSSRGLGLASARTLVAEGLPRLHLRARSRSSWPKRRVEVEAAARRPNMIMTVQADVSTADGIALVVDRDGREVRRPRYPRQQRRARRRHGPARHVATPNGRRRSTRRCFRPFARRAWRCRT